MWQEVCWNDPQVLSGVRFHWTKAVENKVKVTCKGQSLPNWGGSAFLHAQGLPYLININLYTKLGEKNGREVPISVAKLHSIIVVLGESSMFEFINNKTKNNRESVVAPGLTEYTLSN